MTGTRRRTARGAAVATAVLLGGMVPGAQAAPGVQEIVTELASTCDFPEGKQPVKVRTAVEVPESAQAGQVIQPEGMVLELTLPEEVTAGLADSGAAAVSAEAQLLVDVAQEDQHARTEWIGTTAEPAPVPEAGGLTLSTAGSVPYVKPGASGDLSFNASALSVELTMKKADGAPAEPPGTSVRCVVDAGQETTVATVGVEGGDAGTPTPGPSASDEWPEGDEEQGRPVAPEVGTRAKGPVPASVPPCVGDPMNEEGRDMVTYVAGYANVTKLDGATKFPPACARIHTYDGDNYFEYPYVHAILNAAIVLDYRGKPQLPPTTGTFLTFGFMPTTATLEMTQIPPEAGSPEDRNVVSHGVTDVLNSGFTRTTTTVDMDFVLRLYDVKVNGVALDVGKNCRTERPFRLSLAGLGTWEAEKGNEGYTVVTGGELTGSVTIPPFEGCGVDEDLDSVFTASLSGSPGFVKQVQGAPCVPSTGSACTPEHQPQDIPKATR
ncbi:MAG TPA: DUF6801 domain-containing protein [Streptomyces sp.]|uniref:DUF6801 domain-containing protein n=1 Tax=Streptomyces sp. TaxID=1931 RepID=UPI002CDE2725|nr:DUF6801 domain-containing protein [Streptomyces sp.]HWU07047.1 DUF6801 domain-containing protein [Streptomyces sp.]